MRLIDADAIVFTHAIARSIDDGHNWNELCVTKDEIDDMPSAEPERKKGKWIEDETGYGYWTCSVCGFVTEASAAKILYHYCPSCGAYLKGDK